GRRGDDRAGSHGDAVGRRVWRLGRLRARVHQEGRRDRPGSEPSAGPETPEGLHRDHRRGEVRRTSLARASLRGATQPPSRARTSCWTTRPSTRPPAFVITYPMTLPRSPGPDAPVAPRASSISADTSCSESADG